jgi:transcriptional regulator with XRE-family HTH domain
VVVCMAEIETALGTVLRGWMQRQRLTPVQLAALAEVTRRTVYNVLENNGRAEIATLWKLACGLSKDPYTGESDTLVYAEAFPDLLEAAGYPRALAGVIRIDMRDELARQMRDARKVDALLDFLRRYHTLPPGERDAFDRLIGFKSEHLE